MIYILDAAALLNNENFSFERANKYYTTSKVFEEWRDLRSRAFAQSALEGGSLTVQDPCPLSVEKTMEKTHGAKLSDADISIIALAYEFAGRKDKFIVITDDYKIQSFLKKMKIKFRGVLHEEIRPRRKE